uniref:Chitin-binding type-2 domain-containing protein n=1 Tax=Glossina austeni TaxID=7395 RepID=A0A1A9V3M4_GLOAU
MKAAFCLIVCLAVGLSCVLACDPHSDGKPECNSSNVNVKQRNFWDPTHYWECASAGGEPENKRCPDTFLFSTEKGDCIIWNEWVWTPPCPEQA